MEYIKTLVTNNTPIHNAVQLIKLIPVASKLTVMYKRSTKNELMFIGAATFFTLYNISSYIKSKRQRLNLPPAVPFSLPLFGHTLYMMFMPSKFLDWCNEKYGEMYNLDVLGKTITVASGRLGEETMKANGDDLSLDHAIVRDMLHLDYVLHEDVLELGMILNPAIVKAVLPNSKMPNYVPGIQKGLNNACNILLDKEINHIQRPSDFFQNFVAYMSVPGLIGEEFGLNTEVIESFANFTGDVIKSVGIFMTVPKFLHKLVLPFVQSANKHIGVMSKHVGPIVLERREKMRLGIEYEHVENYLQGVIEYVKTDKNGVESHCTLEEVSEFILLIAFASVHTTSMNLSFSIYWLLARPDLMARLLEEIECFIPGNAPVTAEALAKMKFLNNFTREMLRQGVDILDKGKKAMRDFTFSNGYQVPKGRNVSINMRQMNFGDNTTRSKVADMNPDMSMDKISTTPARDFASFGAGKHLCPGRFFAIQEIQMSLIYLLKNYDIKTKDGKLPQPVCPVAGFMITNCESPLVFTRKN